ncbi:MAG: hypothetical protein QY326_02215 [Bdellovibrionota bacterium]|nr:MAG: hypothetical protein QY326_02215 [Bdellovibrionota bacterium]
MTSDRMLPPSYRAIGTELLALETHHEATGYITPSSFKAFRQGVVTISVEVLEAYLEDLLDNSVEDAYLFIERTGRKLWSETIAVGGLVLALVGGMMLAARSEAVLPSFFLTLSLASPFAWLWHRATSRGATRRMFFAHVVSHEIGRRRGITKDGQGRPLTPAVTIQSILKPETGTKAEGAALTQYH